MLPAGSGAASYRKKLQSNKKRLFAVQSIIVLLNKLKLLHTAAHIVIYIYYKSYKHTLELLQGNSCC
jgi:hypothetical protein